MIPNDPKKKYASRLWGRFIVNPPLQYRFAATIAVFLGAAALFLRIQGQLTILYLIRRSPSLDEIAIGHMEKICSTGFSVSLVGIAFAFLISLKLSNFVAGPIYRIEKSLIEIGKGNLDFQIQLRKRDELKSTAEILNNTLSSLREKLTAEQTFRHDICNELNKILEDTDQTTENLRERLATVTRRIETRTTPFQLTH
jgi:methyl-accepting chemotaxis protein